KFIRGYFLNTRMLLSKGKARKKIFEEAFEIWTELVSSEKKYSEDFTILGRKFSPKEARFMMIDLFIESRYYAEALELLSKWKTDDLDLTSRLRKKFYSGILLAHMGLIDEAIKILKEFKGVSPKDCVFLDQALWWLKGVYRRQGVLDDDEDRAKTEVKIIESILEKREVEGFFIKKNLLTPEKLLTVPTPHEPILYKRIWNYYSPTEIPGQVTTPKNWILPPFARDYAKYYGVLHSIKHGYFQKKEMEILLELVKKAKRPVQRENALNRYLESLLGLPAGQLASGYTGFAEKGLQVAGLSIEEKAVARIKKRKKSKPSLESKKSGEVKKNYTIKVKSFYDRDFNPEKDSSSISLSVSKLATPDTPVIKRIIGKSDENFEEFSFISSKLDELEPDYYILKVVWLNAEGDYMRRYYPLSFKARLAEKLKKEELKKEETKKQSLAEASITGKKRIAGK
ncbi:hypothetical protein ACFL35_21940, partial [Candidatus Riflebacteria bacterium]